MLRATHRLKKQIASNGHAADDDFVPLIQEAVVNWTEADAATAVSLNLSLLNRFNFDPSHHGFHFSRYSDDDQECSSALSLLANDAVRKHANDAKFDILWVSSTEFWTLRRFYDYGERHLWHLYTVQVQLDKTMWLLRAFGLRRRDDAKTILHPPVGLPLRFLARVLSSSLHTVSMMEIRFWTEPPVEGTLSLIPTREQSVQEIIVSLTFPSAHLLHAMAEHPIHHRVLLNINFGGPRQIGGLSFVGRRHYSPLFGQVSGNNDLSVTIKGSAYDCQSPKVLEGLALNKRITHVTIDCHDWACGADLRKTPTCMVDLLNQVVFRSLSSVRSLTLVSHYDYVSTYYHPVRDQAKSFDQLSQQLDSRASYAHGLSRFCLVFPYSCQKPLIKSNWKWDLQVSPGLVLNFLHRRGGSGTPTSVSAQAIKRINQGILYQYTCNLEPWDLAASSASATFNILLRLYRTKRRKQTVRENFAGNSEPARVMVSNDEDGKLDREPSVAGE
jgi:hypothetical protein